MNSRIQKVPPPATPQPRTWTSLDLINASFGDYYWRIHDRLQREHKVDHDRQHCPFRNGPGSIHVWTPESGWSVLAPN